MQALTQSHSFLIRKSYYIYKENLQLRKQEAYFLIKGVCLLLSPYFRIMRNKRFTFRDSRQKQ